MCRRIGGRPPLLVLTFILAAGGLLFGLAGSACGPRHDSPVPADPFARALQAAWAGETAPDKARQRDLLAGLYRVAASDTVKRPQLKTLGDLLATLQQAARSLLPADALPKVRAAVAEELRRSLPTVAATPLDDALRGQCGKEFVRVAEALEALR